MHRFRSFAGLLFWMTAVLATAAPALAQGGSGTLPVWAPTPAALKHLAPAVVVGPQSIQPPAGYTESMSSFNYSPAFTWSGAKSAGSGFPPFIQLVVSTPEYKTSYGTADAAAAGLVSDLQKRYTAWTQSAPEHGLINGQPFVRIYWHGTDPHTGAQVRGFDYVTQQKQTFIEISSLQAQPDPQGSLTIAEASAMTYRAVPTVAKTR